MIKHALIFSVIWAGTAVILAQPAFDVRFDGDESNAPPQVASKADLDGTFTKPSFVASKDNEYGIVVQNYHSEMSGKAILLSGKSSLDFIAPRTSFEENGDFTLQFDLLYDGALTDLTKYGLKVNFYNMEVSNEGYQASVVFVPKGIRVVSGGIDETLGYSWVTDTVLRVRINVSYSTEKLEIFINDDFQASVSLDAIAPRGVRAFQFTGGADNSSFVAAITNIKAGASIE